MLNFITNIFNDDSIEPKPTEFEKNTKLYAKKGFIFQPIDTLPSNQIPSDVDHTGAEYAIKDGSTYLVWRNDKGLYHRDDAPAIIVIEGGNVVTYVHCRNGIPHRLDGPAFYEKVGDVKGYFYTWGLETNARKFYEIGIKNAETNTQYESLQRWRDQYVKETNVHILKLGC